MVFVCIERKKDKHNYEGCPLNVLNPNNPIITKRPKGENKWMKQKVKQQISGKLVW